MTAFAKRVKVKPKYDPYPHERTHVFLPDGSHEVVEKTAVGRSSDEYKQELRDLIDPWEKDQILEQAERQKTLEWTKFISDQTPLDKGGLRATRSNVAPENAKNWDTFEISFDRADVDTPEKQQKVFNQVVEWAKEIHTEGLEGGKRAFTIQEWHGLDGSSSRPHLRLEMHRVGWEPTPKLVPSNGKQMILSGKVQRKTNYAQESGETDKDFQPLVSALYNHCGIDLQVGAPSLDREADAKAVSAIPVAPGQEAARLLIKASAEPSTAPTFDLGSEADSLAQLDQLGKSIEASTVAGVVTKSNDPDKSFELRKPVDPFRDQVQQAYLAAQAAQSQFEMLRAAQLTYAQNDQLKEQVREASVLVQDLRTEISIKDTALVERDTALASQTQLISTQQEAIVAQKSALDEAVSTVESLDQELVDARKTIEAKDNDLYGAEQKYAAAIQERDGETVRADKAVEELSTTTTKLEQTTKMLDGVADTLQAVQLTLTETTQQRDQAVRERDAATERNNALIERNGELLGENKVLTANMTGIAAERDAAKADLKVARDELAPVVAENAELKAEKARLVDENGKLIHDIQGEQERRQRLLSLAEVDHETLDAKITRANKIYDELQSALGHDPQALKLLQEVSELVKPKSDYVSRVEVYVQAGLPLKENEEAFAAYNARVNEVHHSDGQFGKEGKKAVVESNKTGNNLASAKPAAPSPATPAGPKPNPMAQGGTLPPRKPGTDPGGERTP